MKIDIYVKAMCPACEQVLDYLDANHIIYNSYVLDYMHVDDIINLTTKVAPGATKAPIIIVENRVVSINELEQIIRSKEQIE